MEFLKLLPKDLEIRGISHPSLHDIFVKVAQGGAQDERRLEDSQVGNHA